MSLVGSFWVDQSFASAPVGVVLHQLGIVERKQSRLVERRRARVHIGLFRKGCAHRSDLRGLLRFEVNH